MQLRKTRKKEEKENWDKFHLTFFCVLFSMFMTRVANEAKLPSVFANPWIFPHKQQKIYRNGWDENGYVEKIFSKIKSTKHTEIKRSLRLLVEPFMRP